MSLWGMLSFQDANSPVMEQMILFHDHAMMVILMIIMLIVYMLMFMFMNKLINRFMVDGQLIEIIWTILPMFLLLGLVIPSLKILYITDDVLNPMISIKSVGHQWYWSYEYNDFKLLNFDSFMVNKEDCENYNMFRLLDVDNRLILPMNSEIRMLISSTDVIHSFAMPVLGMKVDAVPGRINQAMVMINRPGVYFGQCSEICGVNHSFMPIVIESVDIFSFLNWVKKM